MKKLLIIPLFFIISCTTSEIDEEPIFASAAFSYQYIPRYVNRVEIDINGITYELQAENISGGVRAYEANHLPAGIVTRIVFYNNTAPMYFTSEQSHDERTVCFVPFEWYGNGNISCQVYEIEY